MVEERKKK